MDTMVRYLAAIVVALLAITAGCTGALTAPAADATEPAPATDTEPARGGPGAPTSGAGVTGGAGSTGSVAVGSAERGPSAGMAMEASTAVGRASPDAFQPSVGGFGASVGEAGTITVSGTGQVTADPDLALVYVTVQARADSADAARGQVASDVARMRDALRALGVSDEDVRTTYYHVGPRYDYSRDRQELIGYVATHGFEIRSAVDGAGEVVDTAVGNGADTVSGVQFTLTDETRLELRRQALGEAVRDARADADAIAAAADVTITGVSAASTGGPVVVPYAGRLAAAEGADAPTTFDTGPVTVTASVAIAYAIE